MAHIAKYKATSVGHMLAHYRRDASSLERDNIDPKRVKNDMVVAHYTNKDGQLVVGRVVPREGEPNWGTTRRANELEWFMALSDNCAIFMREYLKSYRYDLLSGEEE